MAIQANDIFANATGTVSSGGTTAPAAGTSESWTVATTNGTFPAAQSTATAPTQFRVVDPVQPTEVILITNVSGTTFTAIRGAEGTTPVVHAAGFTINTQITAGWLNAYASSFGQHAEVVPDGCLAETMGRSAITNTGSVIGGTGTVNCYSVYIPIGTKISNVNFYTGGTAAGTPTHWWCGLADSGLVQRAHSTDQTTTAMGASTAFTKAMVTPYTTTYSGTHYVLFEVSASVMPTLQGQATGFTGITGAGPLWFATSSTTQTTPGTDGTTTFTATGATGHGCHYFYLT